MSSRPSSAVSSGASAGGYSAWRSLTRHAVERLQYLAHRRIELCASRLVYGEMPASSSEPQPPGSRLGTTRCSWLGISEHRLDRAHGLGSTCTCDRSSGGNEDAELLIRGKGPYPFGNIRGGAPKHNSRAFPRRRWPRQRGAWAGVERRRIVVRVGESWRADLRHGGPVIHSGPDAILRDSSTTRL